MCSVKSSAAQVQFYCVCYIKCFVVEGSCCWFATFWKVPDWKAWKEAGLQTKIMLRVQYNIWTGYSLDMNIYSQPSGEILMKWHLAITTYVDPSAGKRDRFFLLVSNKLLRWNWPKAAAEGSGLRPLDDSRKGRGSLPKAAARGRSPPLMVTNIGVLFQNLPAL